MRESRRVHLRWLMQVKILRQMTQWVSKIRLPRFNCRPNNFRFKGNSRWCWLIKATMMTLKMNLKGISSCKSKFVRWQELIRMTKALQSINRYSPQVKLISNRVIISLRIIILTKRILKIVGATSQSNSYKSSKKCLENSNQSTMKRTV